MLVLVDDGVGEFMCIGEESVVGCDFDMLRIGVFFDLWCFVLLFT